MHVKIGLLGVVSLIGVASAYDNNCEGSFVGLGAHLGDCINGLNTLDPTTEYSDQAQFSSGNCYIIYATNGAGAQPVAGSVITATAIEVLADCSSNNPPYEGSIGTGNCDSCHVTVNYRS